MAEAPRPRGRLFQVLAVALFWTMVVFFVAGVLKVVQVVRAASHSERLAAAGSRGTAAVTGKQTHRPARRGDLHYSVEYRVIAPPLPEPRRAELAEAEWRKVEVGQTLVYLYDASAPGDGFLEIQRPYVEGWLKHRIGLLPATALCGAYVGWRVARRVRRRAAQGAQN
jgi:hypothetical protein